jgi:tetratricopeptide (TPR) repeat protein
MRIVFLPLATTLDPSVELEFSALTRALPRELAATVRAVTDLETIFRPFVSIIEGKRRFGVYGQRWPKDELAKLFEANPDADLVVHGEADFGDPFRLTIEILRLPDLSPIAEETFEAPRFDGFRAVTDATRLVIVTAGRPADESQIGEFPARGFDAWLDLIRGRDAAASLDGWGSPEAAGDAFEPFLTALDRETGLTAAKEELSFFAAAATGAGMVRSDAAAKALRRMLSADSKCRAGWAALGRVHAAAGELSKAEEAFKKALELDPGRASLRYEMAMVLLRQDRTGRAAKVLETVKADPDLGAEALFELGNIRAGKKDLDGAIALWDESLDRDPSRPLVWAVYGRALSSVGRFDEAEAAFEEGIRSGGSSATLHLAYGIHLAELDRYKPAIDQLIEVLVQKGTEPGAHYHLGRCFEATGDKFRSLHHFRKALSFGGDIARLTRDAVSELRDVDREEKLVQTVTEIVARPADEQVTLLKSVLKEETNYPEARLRLGIALVADGKPRAAEKQFRWVIKRMPEDAEAFSGLATALKARGKLKAAQAAHRDAIERAPNHAGFRLNLADTLLRMGHPEEAAKEVDEARRLDPTNPLIPNFMESVKHHLAPDAGA